MLFSVNTNNNSLAAQKNLMRTNVGLNKTVQKLSSGSRINSSSDDAAGLSISENLKIHAKGYREVPSNGIQIYTGLPTVEAARESLGTTIANFSKEPEVTLEIQANTYPERVINLLR